MAKSPRASKVNAPEVPAEHIPPADGQNAHLQAMGAAGQPRGRDFLDMPPVDPAAPPGPIPAQADVTQELDAQETDVEFALRVFQVNPKTFLKADGTLDRAKLELSIDKYRALYARRLQGGAV